MRTAHDHWKARRRARQRRRMRIMAASAELRAYLERPSRLDDWPAMLARLTTAKAVTIIGYYNLPSWPGEPASDPLRTIRAAQWHLAGLSAPLVS